MNLKKNTNCPLEPSVGAAAAAVGGAEAGADSGAFAAGASAFNFVGTTTFFQSMSRSTTIAIS